MCGPAWFKFPAASLQRPPLVLQGLDYIFWSAKAASEEQQEGALGSFVSVSVGGQGSAVLLLWGHVAALLPRLTGWACFEVKQLLERAMEAPGWVYWRCGVHVLLFA